MSEVSAERNPAVAALGPLTGTWDVTVSRATFLGSPDDTLSGTASIEWLDNAFILIRSSFSEGPPKSLSVIGRNESLDTYSMLYYDVRGVSRVYSMDFDGTVWRLSREDPDFHQRFVGRLGEDGNTITAAWEKSDDGGTTWDHDFDITYVRERTQAPLPRGRA